MQTSANGTFLKVSMAVMACVTLLATGFGASSFLALMEIRRIDRDGTSKAQQLDTRVQVLEKTMEGRLTAIELGITAMRADLHQHLDVPERKAP